MKLNRRNMASLSLLLTRIIPAVSIILLIILWFVYFKDVSVGDILNYTPDNPVIAFIVLMILFALKSLVIFFPVTLLYLSVGAIYSPVWALIINALGITVCLSIPYFLGKLSGQEIVDKLLIKYPKTGKYIKPDKVNSWFYSYIVRIVNPLPGDMRSMLLGALGVPFRTYISSSAVASIPYLVSVTFVGANINNPDSPAFIISLVFTAGVTLASVVLYAFIKKKKQRNNGT